MQPLISVIVPVYKVEDCIVRCLDSLRRQSFTNIEILLIDDASPDNCGKICELYAEKDSRFRVIHNLTNQGLSVARNIGITNDQFEMSMQHYHDLAMWGYPPDKLEKLLINIAFNYCLKKKPDNSDANYVFCANALHNSNSFPSHFSWKLKLLFVLFKYCNPLFELICFLYGTKVS